MSDQELAGAQFDEMTGRLIRREALRRAAVAAVRSFASRSPGRDCASRFEAVELDVNVGWRRQDSRLGPRPLANFGRPSRRIDECALPAGYDGLHVARAGG